MSGHPARRSATTGASSLKIFSNTYPKAFSGGSGHTKKQVNYYRIEDSYRVTQLKPVVVYTESLIGIIVACGE